MGSNYQLQGELLYYAHKQDRFHSIAPIAFSISLRYNIVPYLNLVKIQPVIIINIVICNYLLLIVIDFNQRKMYEVARAVILCVPCREGASAAWVLACAQIIWVACTCHSNLRDAVAALLQMWMWTVHCVCGNFSHHPPLRPYNFSI